MKNCFVIIIFFLCACGDNTILESKDASDTTTFISNDTVPIVRKVVSDKPVASYLVSVNDPKLERSFGVAIFETPYTHQYLMRMHYEAMQITDEQLPEALYRALAARYDTLAVSGKLA